MCLSIAKQYFVHTVEPLCVSVDDEDGDPNVCVFSFFFLLIICLFPNHFKTRILQQFFSLPVFFSSMSQYIQCIYGCERTYVCVCVPSTIITIIISRRTTTRVTSSLFLCSCGSLSFNFDSMRCKHDQNQFLFCCFYRVRLID